jgi:hypothetical protein
MRHHHHHHHHHYLSPISNIPISISSPVDDRGAVRTTFPQPPPPPQEYHTYSRIQRYLSSTNFIRRSHHDTNIKCKNNLTCTSHRTIISIIVVVVVSVVVVVVSCNNQNNFYSRCHPMNNHNNNNRPRPPGQPDMLTFSAQLMQQNALIMQQQLAAY